MDLLGGISSAEWRSLNGIYSSDYHDHDDQFMAVDHHHEYHNFPAHDCTVPNYPGASNLELPFTIWPAGSDSTIIHDMAGTYNHQHSVSKFCSSQIETAFGYDHPDTLAASNVAFCDDQNTDLFVNIEGDQNNYQWLSINQEMSNACNGEESAGSQSTATAHVVPQLRWERTDMMITVPNRRSNIEDASFSGNSKKRSRSTEDDQDTPKNKRNVKSRKNKKVAVTDNEEDGSAGSGEQHSDASQEEIRGMASSPSPKGGAALNLNGKTRATRGSATDPQSVYARKRREKINERLRILQNLVPNGTKVDISTMLEEAVRYVKFLQLQIKLLSTDDLWMYAPLAYNGMDIGLDHLRQLTAPRQ